MKALVLEKVGELSLRDMPFNPQLDAHSVRVKIHTVGICGSDVHYYQHGRIGPFIVEAPMILGHESAGTVLEVGSAVTRLRPGDRVCMEPGIPDPNSRAAQLGLYNLDPAVRFWATPPIHGCLIGEVVHPAAYTFKLPDNVSFAEGAMVEPLAVGMQAATKARITPGAVAVVIGAGPIGLVTALSALAGGCSRVILSDTLQPKLDLAAKLGPILPVNVTKESLKEVVLRETEGWGADLVFEASGSGRAYEGIFELLCPSGCAVLVGMPGAPVAFDVVAAQLREARIETVFRYAHVYPKAIGLMGSRKIDVRPLITDTYPFSKSVEAFDYATKMKPTSVKVQIEMPQS